MMVKLPGRLQDLKGLPYRKSTTILGFSDPLPPSAANFLTVYPQILDIFDLSPLFKVNVISESPLCGCGISFGSMDIISNPNAEEDVFI